MPQSAPKPARKFFIVINPVSGFIFSSAIIRSRLEVHLNRNKIEYKIVETAADQDLTRIVKKAVKEGFTAVVAIGGDGTISAVAGGLAHTGVPLCIIPGGTGNGLARDLGIPLDVERAVHLLLNGTTVKEIDMMLVNGAYHLLNVSTGVSSRTIERTHREEKRRFGLLAYIWSGLKSIVDFRQVKFTLLLDGQAVKIKAKEVMVANGGLFGLEGLSEDPEVILDDGLADVFSLRGDTILDYLRMGLGYLVGKRGRKINVNHWKCREIVISTNKPVLVQSDGEVIGKTPVKVKVEPKAVSVLVPSPAERKRLDQLINLHIELPVFSPFASTRDWNSTSES